MCVYSTEHSYHVTKGVYEAYNAVVITILIFFFYILAYSTMLTHHQTTPNAQNNAAYQGVHNIILT